jgi:hypothetical protein
MTLLFIQLHTTFVLLLLRIPTIAFTFLSRTERNSINSRHGDMLRGFIGMGSENYEHSVEILRKANEDTVTLQ